MDVKDKIKKEVLKKINQAYIYNKDLVEFEVECLPVTINTVTEVITNDTHSSTLTFQIDNFGKEMANDKHFSNSYFVTPDGEKRPYFWYGIVSAKNKLLGIHSIGDELECLYVFSPKTVSSHLKDHIANYDKDKSYALFTGNVRKVEVDNDNEPYFIFKEYPIKELEKVKAQDVMFAYVYGKVKEK